jgi:hypothetical protein
MKVISKARRLASLKNLVKANEVNKAKIRNTKQCVQCGKYFAIRPSHEAKRKCCSMVCSVNYVKDNGLKIGSKNPNYRDAGWKVCQHCGVIFKRGDNRAKYCSRKCYGSSETMRERLKEMSNKPRKKRSKRSDVMCDIVYTYCIKCGVLFVSQKNKKKNRCNYCLSIRKVYPTTKCVVCDASFLNKNNKKTCSVKCLGIHVSQSQLGDKSHLWQGGKTSEAMKIRNSYEYSIWRKSVFERDDYTCQICGVRGGKLSADHIKPFSTHPELRLELSNGRTLCVNCHRKTPTWGRKAVYQ